jgi:hypothetical protein
MPFKPALFYTPPVEFILRDHIPFLEVESLQFHNIIKSLKPKAINHIPKSANMERKWSMDYDWAVKDIVKHQLHNAASKIHISHDIWSLPNESAFLGIIAYWTDNKYTL